MYAASGARLRQAITALTARAVARGDIVMEVEPLDLLRALAGVAKTTTGAASMQAATRLVDILIAGIRNRGHGSAADVPDANG